jgi:hypothetical protein
MHLGQPDPSSGIRVPGQLRQDWNPHDVVLDVGIGRCVIRVDAQQLSELGVTDLMGRGIPRRVHDIAAGPVFPAGAAPHHVSAQRDVSVGVVNNLDPMLGHDQRVP